MEHQAREPQTWTNSSGPPSLSSTEESSEAETKTAKDELEAAQAILDCRKIDALGHRRAPYPHACSSDSTDGHSLSSNEGKPIQRPYRDADPEPTPAVKQTTGQANCGVRLASNGTEQKPHLPSVSGKNDSIDTKMLDRKARKRKSDAIYARKRRMQHRQECDLYRDKCHSLSTDNIRLAKENRQLEGLLDRALMMVQVVDQVAPKDDCASRKKPRPSAKVRGI